MDALTENFDQILDGFVKSLWLLLWSGLIAAVLGTILVSLRVSPIGLLRFVGTSYVNVFRNTPLLLILLLIAFGAPDLGFNNVEDIGLTGEVGNYFNFFFVCATVGLSLYAAAFVCEALRAGINAIPMGQAEAARAIGMTFGQSMRMVILPQAFRAVIPPLTSTYIALAKNTSVAIAIGVTEASFVMKKLNDEYATERWPIFFGFAFGYVVIVAVIAAIGNAAERRVRVA